jgi:hypothetical protein
MRKSLAASLLGFALFVGSTAASAEIHILTLEGSVDSGIDGDNAFGFAGGSLAGQHYVSKYVYDTSLGLHSSTANFDYYQRDGLTGVSPITSASLTINGITRELGAADNATLYFGVLGSPGGDKTGISVIAEQSQFGPTALSINSIGAVMFFDASSPFSLDTDFSAVSGTPYAGLSNKFSIKTNPYVGTPGETFGFLLPTSALISSPGSTGGPGTGTGSGGSPSAVPEPASWAMMLMGFGLVGSLLRRRTPKHSVSAIVV